MAREKKVVGPNDFKWVRSIYGKGPEASQRYHHIPDGGMNDIIKEWHDKQEDGFRAWASPSQLTACPRVVWLQNNDVPVFNTMTWAVKQRLLLGRLFENQFATELDDAGKLVYHWKDNPGVEVDKFQFGEGVAKFTGVPDYIIKTEVDGDEVVAVSDAKTSRSDSFGYVPIELNEAAKEGSFKKYKIQVDGYYKLCIENPEFFEKNKLPLPTHCHLFSYALDDGVVRREFTWKPTQHDLAKVEQLARRFNLALSAESMPECTCQEEDDNYQMKFCPYGVVEPGSKVAESCCDPGLANQVES